MLLELVGRDPVCDRSLLAPFRVPDPGSLENGIGIDRVDPNPVGPELLGETASEMERSGLGGRVRRCIPSRRKGVLRADEDDAASGSLGTENARGLPRDA